MSKYLYSILKPEADKSWMVARIKELIPHYATTYVDPLFSSDILLTVPQWESMVIRPRSQYESRVIHALLESGLNWIEELNELFSTSEPFSFGTKYRPRIVTSISDAELIAHAVSIQHMVQKNSYGVYRYKTFMKTKINVKKVMDSLLRLCRILQTKDITIIPTGERMPLSLIGRTDLVVLNVANIPADLFDTYMDPLSWSGRKVMLIGGLPDRHKHYAKEYNTKIVHGPKKRKVHIIRNYQV